MKYVDFFKHYEQVRDTQRIGQYFCNIFNITDPQLFYEKDNKAAIDLIYKKYLLMFDVA